MQFNERRSYVFCDPHRFKVVDKVNISTTKFLALLAVKFIDKILRIFLTPEEIEELEKQEIRRDTLEKARRSRRKADIP